VNTSEKSFKPLAASVAAVIIASVWAAVIGIGVNDAMATSQEIPTATYVSPLIDPVLDEPYIDPIAQWKLENNIPFFPNEVEYIDSPYVEPETDSWVYPEVLPLSIPLVQADGGVIHCKPWTTTASVATRGGFTLNGQLVETWEDLNGLYFTPRGKGIKPGRVAIIVDGKRAAMLPGADGDSDVFLPAYDWLDDEMYFSPKVQLCIVGKNG
jgi:hypothetical protein